MRVTCGRLTADDDDCNHLFQKTQNFFRLNEHPPKIACFLHRSREERTTRKPFADWCATSFSLLLSITTLDARVKWLPLVVRQEFLRQAWYRTARHKPRTSQISLAATNATQGREIGGWWRWRGCSDPGTGLSEVAMVASRPTQFCLEGQMEPFFSKLWLTRPSANAWLAATAIPHLLSSPSSLFIPLTGV